MTEHIHRWLTIHVYGVPAYLMCVGIDGCLAVRGHQQTGA